MKAHCQNCDASVKGSWKRVLLQRIGLPALILAFVVGVAIYYWGWRGFLAFVRHPGAFVLPWLH